MRPIPADAVPAPNIGEGWHVLGVPRRNNSAHVDKYYFTPGGRRLRSRKEVERFEEALRAVGGTDEDAAWRLMSPRRARKQVKTKSASKPDIGDRWEILGAAESSGSKSSKRESCLNGNDRNKECRKTASKPAATNRPALRCIMCVAHGRIDESVDFRNQLLPVRLHLQTPTTGGQRKATAAYVHACCALRAPPCPPLDPDQTPEWWSEVIEMTHGHSGLPETRFSSTSSMFVPYSLSDSEWMDEFTLYNVRMLLASERRFAEGRTRPYNLAGSSAVLWRGDDRGSIGFVRMVPDLVERAAVCGLSAPNESRSADGEVPLSPAEAVLWGAIAYRCFNRLSTFSRWAALTTLAAKRKLPVSKVLQHSSDNGHTSLYEASVHGPQEMRDEELHALAASGVSMLGRNGYRDKWGKEVCEQQMTGKRSPMCCVAALPLPSDLNDFKTFVEWEVWNNRGVMTGEHQVQSMKGVLAMLRRLCGNNCAGLKTLSAFVQKADSAQLVLDALMELNTVGSFFAWQIFSDLVAVQDHFQLFPGHSILPSTVVEDSKFKYALFGPGARKGASMVGERAPEVLEFDKDVSQATALDLAKQIIADFPAALKRIKLNECWARLARGRPFDLETCEHSLCGYYGALPVLVINGLESDEKASNAMKAAATDAKCIWPPGSMKGGSHSVGTREKQGGEKWMPNPSTAMERQHLRQMAMGTLAVAVKEEEGDTGK